VEAARELTDVQHYLQVVRNKETSLACLQDSLAHYRVSHKRTETRAMEQDRDARLAFCIRMSVYDLNNVVWIDETMFNRFGVIPRWGWAPVGERAVTVVQGRNFRNRQQVKYTLIGGISPQGVVAWYLLEGTATSVEFSYFMLHMLPVNRATGANTIAVLDNCSIHLNQRLTTWFAARGGHIVRLPPFSSDKNPIELAWRPLKRFIVKNRFWYYQNPVACITAAVQIIAPINCRNYIRSAMEVAP